MSIDKESVSLAPPVMMKMLSKMRKASRVRKSSATMTAAFMLGRTTFHMTCHHEAPSTFAASSIEESTWARPARRSRDMKGVVFQISESEMTKTEGQKLPNQS